MKSLLLFLLASSCSPAFSQQTKVYVSADTSDVLPVVLNYKTHGYINGIRLDSIDTQYAEFGFKGGDGVSFYYGLNFPKSKDLFIKNEKNVPLVFINRSMVFLLNFFYFNGWEIANATYPSDNGKLLLKKINR